MSLSVIAPTPEWMHLDPHLLSRHALQRVGKNFDGARNVALEDERQFLDAGVLDLLGKAFERDAATTSRAGLALLHLAVLRDALGLVAVGNDQEGIAGIRHAFETQNFDRSRGAGFVDGAAAIVKHGANLAEGVADDEAVARSSACRSEPARWRQRRGRDRAWLRSTVPTAARSGVALRSAVGDQADHFQQQVEVHPLLRRDIDEDGVAAPFFGNKAAVAKLLLHRARDGHRACRSC